MVDSIVAKEDELPLKLASAGSLLNINPAAVAAHSIFLLNGNPNQETEQVNSAKVLESIGNQVIEMQDAEGYDKAEH